VSRDRSILLLGSRSDFSAIVLTHLARAGVGGLRAALLRSSGSDRPSFATAAHNLPVSVPDPLSRAAEASGTPLDILNELGDLRRTGREHDLIVTACFPRRLPAAVREQARMSCLNLHPSLLPAYRGPAPLFWQLRAGVSNGGVTIHKLNDELDTGDIVAADSLTLPPQMSAAELNRLLVEAGSRLLVRTLRHHDWRAFPGTPQNCARASYFSWPAPDDFNIPRCWPAERAFRFMCGTLDWGHPYAVSADGVRLVLDRALSYDPQARLSQAWTRRAETVQIGFNPGVLRAVVREVLVTPRGKAHPAAGRA
jgi:methionyl-tRNA formyltransferase